MKFQVGHHREWKSCSKSVHEEILVHWWVWQRSKQVSHFFRNTNQ